MEFTFKYYEKEYILNNEKKRSNNYGKRFKNNTIIR